MTEPTPQSVPFTITTGDGPQTIQTYQNADGKWVASQGNEQLPLEADTHPELVAAVTDHFTQQAPREEQPPTVAASVQSEPEYVAPTEQATLPEAPPQSPQTPPSIQSG